MKIIHLACVAPPIVGGIGRIAFLETESLVQRGFEAELLSPASFPNALSWGNVAWIPSRHLLEKIGDADIVHLHYPFYFAAGSIARLRKQGKIKRVCMTLHMDATAPGIKGIAANMHRSFFQSKILASADALCASSKDYVEHSSYAQVADRVIELPFGVDEGRFRPGAPQRQKFGIPADARVVAFVGGMDTAHAFKGVDVLLRAAAQLARNTCVVLVGDGDKRPSYEALARSLGIADRVRFLGSVAGMDLPDLYRSADVLAFPSTSPAEAFGLVALEAQACGIPVVASDLPGVRTVIQDKVTGLLTPTGDAVELAAHLRLILENPDMGKTFGTVARERVLRQFTWSKHMDGLVSMYENVCASRS